MTDDEMIDGLHRALAHFNATGDNYAVYAIVEAIRRLTSKSVPEGALAAYSSAAQSLTPAPVPEGWRQVRVFVACSNNGGVASEAIDPRAPDKEAHQDNVLRLVQHWLDCHITHRAIITAAIPPISVPVVQGKMEAPA